MKKTVIAAALITAPFLLSSCSNLDEPGGGQTQEVKIACSVINHLTPFDSSKEIVMTKGDYNVLLNAPKRTASVSTSNLKFGNSDHTFGTKDMAMTATGYTVGYSYGEIYAFRGTDGNMASSGNAEITDLSAKVTPFGYFSKVYVPGYPQYSAMPLRLVMSYRYDSEYTVRTIPADSFYSGKTTSTYPVQGGAVESYETETPLYRLVLNTEKMTADVIIYDAQFAPQMPKMTAMVVKGLTLTATRDGFTAKGESIIPETVEGGMVTPFPSFPFNTIEVRSTGGDLTQATIDYSVGGRFTGKFTGINAILGQ